MNDTFYRPPLPDVPEKELRNTAVTRTLTEYPHLFKIVTPINVDRFEELTQTHPNQPFVKSVCKGLREGFWSYADAFPDSYPDMFDNCAGGPKDERQARFMQDQRDDEIRQDRYSQTFGTNLLPGMYNIPIHAVPKPPIDSGKLRLVIDMSAGEFAPNSVISRESIAGLHLDGMRVLGEALIRFRAKYPNVRLVMFKSDVSQAYRRLPMHPRWQIKQVVTVDGDRHVNRCNDFGGRGSFAIWVAFFGLVIWVAVFICFLEDIMAYVDDSFSFEVEGNVKYYEPYKMYFPRKQTKLLQLWDELGIPHEKKKQEYGPKLTIIGFEVDPNAMTVTLPACSKALFVEHIKSFLDRPPGGKRKTLREFQKMAGYANWAFNVFPLLRPSLCAMYEKMAGKSQQNLGIYVNNSMRYELSWLADRVEMSDGIHFLRSREWGPEHPDVYVAYTDASGIGLAFWFPSHNVGFQCPKPKFAPNDAIFFFEALAVCSAVHHASMLSPAPRKLVIYTDNTNTVAMYDSLRALPDYNHILISSVNVLLDHSIELHVLHVPGLQNKVADALSRFRNDEVLALSPHLQIGTFQPPQDALGAAKQ
ncbi:hypothetical protein NEOLEDRAFT_1077945 [Neolentinus lepideus HHB14362 ss-1]|uniref:DNA/RNA polymerase n=1 Tax=Neolentinus lepideus HHB14362 ss-1 TaxID=1314782 RepID=A0A165NAZ0_9AGAM|nr:hypothetical protein NEOLEDRAFT_1077945 [Neolentinus lepideus HHB14362 ss-1]